MIGASTTSDAVVTGRKLPIRGVTGVFKIIDEIQLDRPNSPFKKMAFSVSRRVTLAGRAAA